MWARVIQLRDKGQRLARAQWPQPWDGDLTLRNWDGKTNVHKRTIRIAELWHVTELAVYRNMLLTPISDPELVDVLDGAFLLRGIEIASVQGTIFEFIQVWHCTPLFDRPADRDVQRPPAARPPGGWPGQLGNGRPEGDPKQAPP